MAYKSKVNPDLFEECLDIANEISQLKAIVQNDLKITDEELEEFEEQVKGKVKKLWLWKKKIIEYVKQAPVV